MLTQNTRRQGFTLVEIMVVVAIISLIASIALPSFMRARGRSQAAKMRQEVKMLDGALEQYAAEHNTTLKGNDVPSPAELADYIKDNSDLKSRLLESGSMHGGGFVQAPVGTGYYGYDYYSAVNGASNWSDPSTYSYDDVRIEVYCPAEMEEMVAPDYWRPYQVWYGTWD